MKITFYGHASFLVEIAGKKLLFDPFISPNEQARHIDITQIEADYVLLSHGHMDHVADAESILKRTGAMLISTFEVTEWFQKQGIENAHPMNHGGTKKLDMGTVKLVNAVHSSNLPDGSYGGNPAGFVIQSDEGSFYYSGDTALTYDMKLIGEFHSLDFAILCIGDNFTMGIEDAVRASDFIQCDHIIGMHYDTFGYIEIDHEAAKTAFQNAGKTLRLLNIGDTLEIQGK